MRRGVRPSVRPSVCRVPLDTDIRIRCTSTRIYTVFQKLHPFYFCDNFVGHEPILTIFGKNVAKTIGMPSLTRSLLTVQMSYS